MSRKGLSGLRVFGRVVCGGRVGAMDFAHRPHSVAIEELTELEEIVARANDM